MTGLPARFAVAEMSEARIPGQFRLTLTPCREFVQYEIAAWSVGLRWLTFIHHNAVHDYQSPLFLQRLDAEYLEAREHPGTEEWMRKAAPRHMEMHEAANLQGLEPGDGNGLPVERILVDRLLKEMVQHRGVDLHGPAEAIGSNDDHLQFFANNQEYMGTSVGGRHFQLRQLGMGLPVLSTWMSLGPATYCGHALDLHHQLPEVLSAGVVGRRLGDLVATSVPMLDARVVTGVVSSRDSVMDHWPTDTMTRLYLEPDLVELGSQQRPVTHGCV